MSCLKLANFPDDGVNRETNQNEFIEDIKVHFGLLKDEEGDEARRIENELGILLIQLASKIPVGN